jgi:hypothetical protein
MAVAGDLFGFIPDIYRIQSAKKEGGGINEVRVISRNVNNVKDV